MHLIWFPAGIEASNRLNRIPLNSVWHSANTGLQAIVKGSMPRYRPIESRQQIKPLRDFNEGAYSCGKHALACLIQLFRRKALFNQSIEGSWVSAKGCKGVYLHPLETGLACFTLLKKVLHSCTPLGKGLICWYSPCIKVWKVNVTGAKWQH